MRGSIPSYIAGVASLALAPLLLACEGVPDLRFAAPQDASASSPSSYVDATLGDDAPSEPPDASTSPDDAAATDDAPGPTLPDDAATPPPPGDGAAPTDAGCPAHPPPGVTCCGAVACKGNPQQCNCSLCAYCASQGVCCPSQHPAPGYCATALSLCHP